MYGGSLRDASGSWSGTTGSPIPFLGQRAAVAAKEATEMSKSTKIVAGGAALGIVLFREPATAMRLVCIGLIVAGIIGLRVATPG